MTELLAGAALGFRFGVGLLLVNAALPKLFANDDFVRAVRTYRLLPSGLEVPVGRGLPLLELGLGVSLLLGVGTRLAAAAVAAMMLAFSVAVAINLARGRRIECGCRSSVAARVIGWPLVAQDAALAGVSVCIALNAPSALSLHVMNGDGSTVLATSNALAVLVTAVALVQGNLVLREARRIRRAKSRLEDLAS